MIDYSFPTIEHKDGIPWHEAPIPRRLHRCAVQTQGWIGFTMVQRCACGATMMRRFEGDHARWIDRNQRRRA